MIRRYGPPPDPTRRYRARPGAYAVLVREGLALLTLQEEPQREFQLPGGGVDPGESLIRALHREVLEETGWRIAEARAMGCFRRFVYMPDYGFHAEKICHIFHARPVMALGPPSERSHRAVWMPVRDAARMVGNPGDAAALARVAG